MITRQWKKANFLFVRGSQWNPSLTETSFTITSAKRSRERNRNGNSNKVDQEVEGNWISFNELRQNKFNNDSGLETVGIGTNSHIVSKSSDGRMTVRKKTVALAYQRKHRKPQSRTKQVKRPLIGINCAKKPLRTIDLLNKPISDIDLIKRRLYGIDLSDLSLNEGNEEEKHQAAVIYTKKPQGVTSTNHLITESSYINNCQSGTNIFPKIKYKMNIKQPNIGTFGNKSAIGTNRELKPLSGTNGDGELSAAGIQQNRRIVKTKLTGNCSWTGMELLNNPFIRMYRPNHKIDTNVINKEGKITDLKSQGIAKGENKPHTAMDVDIKQLSESNPSTNRKSQNGNGDVNGGCQDVDQNFIRFREDWRNDLEHLDGVENLKITENGKKQSPGGSKIEKNLSSRTYRGRSKSTRKPHSRRKTFEIKYTKPLGVLDMTSKRNAIATNSKIGPNEVKQQVSEADFIQKSEGRTGIRSKSQNETQIDVKSLTPIDTNFRTRHESGNNMKRTKSAPNNQSVTNIAMPSCRGTVDHLKEQLSGTTIKSKTSLIRKPLSRMELLINPSRGMGYLNDKTGNMTLSGTNLIGKHGMNKNLPNLYDSRKYFKSTTEVNIAQMKCEGSFELLKDSQNNNTDKLSALAAEKRESIDSQEVSTPDKKIKNDTSIRPPSQKKSSPIGKYKSLLFALSEKSKAQYGLMLSKENANKRPDSRMKKSKIPQNAKDKSQAPLTSKGPRTNKDKLSFSKLGYSHEELIREKLKMITKIQERKARCLTQEERFKRIKQFFDLQHKEYLEKVAEKRARKLRNEELRKKETTRLLEISDKIHNNKT